MKLGIELSVTCDFRFINPNALLSLFAILLRYCGEGFFARAQTWPFRFGLGRTLVREVANRATILPRQSRRPPASVLAGLAACANLSPSQAECKE
jgi:hypothetical protein